MSRARKTITHGVALLAGAGIAAVFRKAELGEDPGGSGGKAQAAEVVQEEAKESNRMAAEDERGGNKPAAYLRAWRLLAQEALPPEERMRVQGHLLKKWAAVDLDGAIQAYLGEAWDTRYPGTVAFISEPLRNALFGAFSERPLESWRALSRDQMAMQRLGTTWNAAMRYKDPQLMASLVHEMPANLQVDAVQNLMGHEKHAELLDQLAKSGTPEEVERWMTTAC